MSLAEASKRMRALRIRELACGRFELPVGEVLVIRTPVRLQSEANMRENRFVRATRIAQQKYATLVCLNAFSTRPPEPPLEVTIVRLIGPKGRRLDDDNLIGSAKHVRDQLASWLGIDDRHRDLVRYVVREEKAATHGTRIEIRRMGGAT